MTTVYRQIPISYEQAMERLSRAQSGREISTAIRACAAALIRKHAMMERGAA